MKISYSAYVDMLSNPATRKRAVKIYSSVEREAGTNKYYIKPHPDRVTRPKYKTFSRSFLANPNTMLRNDRRTRFQSDVAHRDRPILLVEGDSWVHFPYAVDDMLQGMYGFFNIWAVGAAGDENANMIHGPSQKYGKEYLRELRSLQKHKLPADAYLFSGAGNDIIGEDTTGQPVLQTLLKSGSGTDPNNYINETVFEARLKQIFDDYSKMITEIHNLRGYENLPIFIHGYAHAYPYPHGDDEKRRKRCYQDYADQWLGRAFAAHSISNHTIRHAVITIMIDRLYVTLGNIAQHNPNVHLLDARPYGAKLDAWHDEIHLKSRVFRKMGRAFRKEMLQVLKTNS